MRSITLFALTLLLAGCAELARPTPAPVVWGVDVPGPIATYEVVAQGSSGVSMLPASPTGAVVGVDYAYRMPPCGTLGLIDVDGSFWDAVDLRGNPDAYSFVGGTFRLTSPNRATFTSPDAEALQLERHRGSKLIGYCM